MSEDKQQVEFLIEGAVVLPMTGPEDLIWDGSIAVDAGRIVAVGERDELERVYVADETIDASGQLAMPGLVNTHGVLASAIEEKTAGCETDGCCEEGQPMESREQRAGGPGHQRTGEKRRRKEDRAEGASEC